MVIFHSALTFKVMNKKIQKYNITLIINIDSNKKKYLSRELKGKKIVIFHSALTF